MLVRDKPARGAFDHAQRPALPRQDEIDPFIPLEPGGANDLTPTGRMWAASIHLSCVRVTVSIIRRAQDAQFVSAQHHETARPCFDIFAAKDPDNPPGQRQAPGIGQTDEQQAVMRSGLELAHVGKVEVLRDEKPARGLRRRPYVRVVVPCQTFLPHIVRVVISRRKFGDQ